MRNGDLYIMFVVIGVILMFAAGFAASPGSKMSLQYPESEHIQQSSASYECMNKNCSWMGNITEMSYKDKSGIIELYCPECGAYIGWEFSNEYYNV